MINDGTARCWGFNGYGELGDGTNASRSTPVTVVGLTGASDITAAGDHTCALINDGTARCWGDNLFGELGDGTSTNRSTPVAVWGLTNAETLTASDYQTCALTDNGTSRCWGLIRSAQLGDSSELIRTVTGLSTTVVNPPVTVPEGLPLALSLSAVALCGAFMIAVSRMRSC